MLRAEGCLFLDNTSLGDVESALGLPVRVVENTGEGFWRAVCGMEDN